MFFKISSGIVKWPSSYQVLDLLMKGEAVFFVYLFSVMITYSSVVFLSPSFNSSCFCCTTSASVGLDSINCNLVNIDKK